MKNQTIFFLLSVVCYTSVHGAAWEPKTKDSEKCLNKALSLAIATNQPEMVKLLMQSNHIDIDSHDSHRALSSNALTMLDRAKEGVITLTERWRPDEVVTKDTKNTLEDKLQIVQLLTQARAAQDWQSKKAFDATIQKFENFSKITVGSKAKETAEAKEETVEIIHV